MCVSGFSNDLKSRWRPLDSSVDLSPKSSRYPPSMGLLPCCLKHVPPPQLPPYTHPELAFRLVLLFGSLYFLSALQRLRLTPDSRRANSPCRLWVHLHPPEEQSGAQQAEGKFPLHLSFPPLSGRRRRGRRREWGDLL